jgi:fimbrial isopeptide formation D2 family protein
VKNPVAEKPTMQETKPYKGTGVLGAVKVGDSITYEISYHNYKSEKATIVIKDKLDPNLKFESASNSGTNVEGVVTWTLKDVKADGKGKVTLTVKVLDGALASKGGPGKVVNNGETVTVQVGDDKEFTLTTIENPVPEPPVKKETSPYVGTGVLETVNVDDEVTYEISYKNYKAEEATVVITDKLDKNVEFVSADNNGEHKDGTVTWTLANVAAGAEGKVTLTVKVKDGAKKSKKITNKATVQVGKDQKFTTEEVTNPVSNKTTAPETGDDSHNELWLTLLILSLLGGSFFGVTAFKGKKTGKN